MRRVNLGFAALCVPLLCAAADPVDLFRRHHYEEAAAIWEKDARNPSPLDERGVRALKGLSLAHFQLGSLYGRLHPFSLALASEFYRGVTAQDKSALPLFYWGQVQYQKGRFDSAAACFEKALKLGSGRGKDPDVLEQAKVFLAYSRAREKGGANPRLTLRSEAAKWQALDLAGADPSSLPAALRASSSRGRRCRLSILARSGAPRAEEIRQAIQAVLRDTKAPERTRDRGRGTQMDFYDPFLLETLSRAYLALSQWEQTRLREEEKRFPELASRFATNRGLAQASLLRGRYAEALQFLGDDDAPEAGLLRAEILGKQGKLAEARAWLDGVERNADSAAVFREIAESYYFLGIDSQKALRLAAKALRDRDGANYYRISAALLLATGQNDAALQEYEKGYNPEFRNRIDQIDPEYISDYAFALFLNRKTRYEEIVETLYYLQKEIPACRQMHYAMQGVSAAQARGYEPQRIFRKGG